MEFAEVLGISLLPWQKWLCIHLLELLDDGRLRFRTAVVLVARQNGKSTVAMVIILFFMFTKGWAVLGTAQDLETSEALWAEAVKMVDPAEHEDDPDFCDELGDEVRRISLGSGQKGLTLWNGATYRVKATTRRGGRGKHVQLVVLDELREHGDFASWSAVSKTIMAQDSGMVLALSNAGDHASVVLRHLRRLGHLALGDPDGVFSDASTPVPQEPDEDGEETALGQSLGLFEWSTPPGASRWDRDTWGLSNPSMGHRRSDGSIGIREETIAAAAATDPPAEFMTEVQCQWLSSSRKPPFPEGAWEAGTRTDTFIPPDQPIVYGLDVSWDRSSSYIAAAGINNGGVPQVEIAARLPRTEFTVDWFKARANIDSPITVVAQGKGSPVSSIIPDLEALDGVNVVRWQGDDLGAWYGRFFDLVTASQTDDKQVKAQTESGLAHLPQPVLDVAAGSATWKTLGDTRVIDRKASPEDASPLIAAVAAVGYLTSPHDTQVSAYEHTDGVFYV
ncbi:terminase [Actinomyces bovis]|uniref:terminase n=1 Tax=Actinomyces bovis TaxID=1658 RepID=UPI000DCFBA9D|nr:terminase [Actinomyces bovis]